MLTLWLMGRFLEPILGHRNFLIVYLIAALGRSEGGPQFTVGCPFQALDVRQLSHQTLGDLAGQIAEFDHFWGTEVTRTREIVEVAEELSARP